MFASGEFVAEHLEPHDGGELDDEQIQPNGVDLTIDKIFKLTSQFVLKDGDYIKCDREEAKLLEDGGAVDVSHSTNHNAVSYGSRENIESSDKYDVDNIRATDEFIDEPIYVLRRNPYVVVYNEVIKIPEGFVGMVFPRSRLLRNCMHLTTAVWDTGYEGRGEGALMVNAAGALSANMRIGQMCFIRCEDYTGSYDGSHQGERLEEE